MTLLSSPGGAEAMKSERAVALEDIDTVFGCGGEEDWRGEIVVAFKRSSSW